MPRTAQGGNPRDLASGIAITLLIFASAVYLPIIGFMGSLLLPLPVLFYRLKLGRQTGAIIPMGTLVVMSGMLGGLTVDMLYFAGLLFIGFSTGEFLEMDLSIEKTVAGTCGAVLLAGVFGLLLCGGMTAEGVYTLLSDYVAKNLELTLALYESMGMPQETIHMVSSSLDSIQYLLVRILPALAVASTLFVTWINLLAARPLLERKEIFRYRFGALTQWKAPEPLVFGAIGCGILLVAGGQGVRLIGINGLIVLMTVYFFQGMAITQYYFDKKKFPPMLRFFLYSVIALQQLLLLVIVGLGFFDMWMNFRKLGPEKNNQ